MENVYIFSHITKSAGTTFREVLERNFGSRYMELPHDFHEGIMPYKNISSFLDNKTHLRAIASHRFSVDLPYDHANYRIIAISFLRDPVDRLVSEYYYVKNLGHSGIIAESSSLEEFVSVISERPGAYPFYTNNYSKYMNLDEKTMAQRIQDGRIHLFPMGRFDESLIYLKKMYPEHFRDVSYSRSNTNVAKPEKVDAETKRRIKKLLSRDSIIYEMAKANFENVINASYTQKELRKDMKCHLYRCRFRRTILKPVFGVLQKVSQKTKTMKLP